MENAPISFYKSKFERNLYKYGGDYNLKELAKIINTNEPIYNKFKENFAIVIYSELYPHLTISPLFDNSELETKLQDMAYSITEVLLKDIIQDALS